MDRCGQRMECVSNLWISRILVHNWDGDEQGGKGDVQGSFDDPSGK